MEIGRTEGINMVIGMSPSVSLYDFRSRKQGFYRLSGISYS